MPRIITTGAVVFIPVLVTLILFKLNLTLPLSAGIFIGAAFIPTQLCLSWFIETLGQNRLLQNASMPATATVGFALIGLWPLSVFCYLLMLNTAYKSTSMAT